MVKLGSEGRVSDRGNPNSDSLTADDVIMLAKGSDLSDDALAELAAKVGGNDDLIALIFDATLQILKSNTEKAGATEQESRDFHRQFEAEMAKLRQSQRETKAMLENLVNG